MIGSSGAQIGSNFGSLFFPDGLSLYSTARQL